MSVGYARLMLKTPPVGDAFYIKDRVSDDDILRFSYAGATDEGVMDVLKNDAIKIRLRANGVSYFNNGNIGIGTTTPVAQLNLFKAGSDDGISSSIYLQRSAGHYGCAILQVGNGSAGTEELVFTAGHNNNPVAIANARMTVGTEGVGIGTRHPDGSLFSVNGTASITGELRVNGLASIGGITTPTSSSNLNVLSLASIRYSASAATTKRLDFQASNTSNSIQSVSNPLHFYDNSAVRMAILQGGNVGIGTSNPTQKLVVYQGNIGVTDAYKIGDIAGQNAMMLGYHGGNGISWQSSSADSMFLDAGGQLGVGISLPSGILHAELDGTGIIVANKEVTGNAFEVHGAQGNLFTITDDLSDSLMSVNDAAGMPVFEVFADDTIKSYRNNESKFEIDPDNNQIRLRDDVYISGSLTITGGLQFALPSSELTESNDATDDKILLWDESVDTWKYMTLDNLQDSIDTAGGGGAVSAVANGSNNRVATFSSADALNGESNLTFDGTNLAVNAGTSAGSRLSVNGDVGISGTTRIKGSLGVGQVGPGGTAPVPDLEFHISDGNAGSVAADSSCQAVIESSVHAGLQFLSPATASASILFGDPDSTAAGFVSYVHGTSQDYLSLGAAGVPRAAIDSSATQVTGDLRVHGDANPSRNDESDMGTASLKWRAGHFNDIHIHGAADYGGVSIAGTRFLVFDANNYTVDYLNASEIIFQSAISVNDTSVSHSQAITFTVTINGASTSTVAVTWPAGS